MDIDDLLAEVSAGAIPQQQRDLQELTRAWVAERCAPEILEWPENLMGRVLGRIRKQIELVEEQTGDMDAKTNFKLIIVQTELERFKFLVRSFLRARIKKIDAHPHHLLSLLPTNPRLLSPSEQQYLTAHQSLLSAHYAASFLSQFPAPLQKLDDTTGGVSMIDRPDTQSAVFARALRDCEVWSEGGGEGARVRMRRGDVWVVRWGGVRAAVERGDVELI
ncbi:GINS complex, Sld5 component [Westerdykella ornata]|uniref:DNA replication complex GINS protein SLD5 n=1 Tax=Westerdykella ornata TaxID=318751 RepID=A0A6A6J527_WESOR|nr:GINS complex, Sld5 component [Westerdykella ornata]KAF2271681.1 GINS complex, Sld5 component [Westerdykella ornata]